jgi:type VI secretion system protein ImpA
MPANAELVAALLVPVPGDNPSGKDLRYDPRYDRIKEARREDLDLPPGGLATERKVADWNAVVTQARQLLEKETKDLQLAAWLTEALLKREGAAGLATGLLGVGGLLTTFWDTLYPELDPDDLELRAGPIEWIGTRLDIAARQIPIATGGIGHFDFHVSRSIPTEDDAKANEDKAAARDEALSQGKRAPEVVDKAIAGTPKAFYKTLVADLVEAQAALASVEQVADERFGRDAPSLVPLRKALDEVQRSAATLLALKLQSDPDPVVAEAGDGAAAVGSYAPPPGWAPDGNGAPLAAEPTSAADAGARVAGAARFLRQADPASPAPYLMLRGYRWGELRATPGDVDPRLLEAPPTAQRARLKALLLDEKWDELLEQGEQLMAAPHGRGWLDLQRYTLTACDRLGGEYGAVATAVRAELRALLAALPRLPQMTLMDDTPTANAETQQWLESEGLAGNGEAPAAEDGDVAPDDGSGALDEALAQEDETAENGGFGRPATRRRRAGATRDPFALARAEQLAGRPNKGIELLVDELARERSPRGRFVRETQIAYVMVEAGMFGVARPILEQLVKVIGERNLEGWEAGALVAQPMALLCRVIDAAGDDGDAELRRDLYLRLCRLDPLQGITLQAR